MFALFPWQNYCQYFYHEVQVNDKEIGDRMMNIHFLFVQHCFFLPGPPNFVLSRQLERGGKGGVRKGAREEG